MYYVLINDRQEIVAQRWFDEKPSQPNPVKNISWYKLVEVRPTPLPAEKISTAYALTIDGETATKTYLVVMKTTEELTAESAAAQKAQDIIDGLPTWKQVSDAIDAVSTIAGLKVVVKKLARVVYWLAKNSAT